MKKEPGKPYVYQPLPPSSDGKFYGVAGFGFQGAVIKGISKRDALHIVEVLGRPETSAIDFLDHVTRLIAEDWDPDCGCRFESLFSNAVLLCEECSKLPCHTGEGLNEN